MDAIAPFEGFSPRALDYLNGLAANNNRTWFEEHRPEYEQLVREPCRSFVVAMGQALEAVAPAIHAEPKVNRSMFRISRDTRFSADKTPYKSHVAMFWWEGAGRRMDCAGFYFHYMPGEIWMGAGAYVFTRPQLKAYRQAVVHPEHGPELEEAYKQVTANGCGVVDPHYKRIPKGFDKDHPRAGLLLNTGVWTRWVDHDTSIIHSTELVDYCFGHFVDMLPVYTWARDLIARVDE